jgi:hypothetical protein
MVLRTVKARHFSPQNNGSKVNGTRIVRLAARRSSSSPLGGLKNAVLSMMTMSQLNLLNIKVSRAKSYKQQALSRNMSYEVIPI